jgi:CDP-diacylglycerol--glycerol-3-phosphate 3-phosphatidyltransferase
MANWITLSRLPLLLVYVLILFYGNAQLRLIGVPLILLLMFLDSVDGIVARRTNSVSLIGSVLDIATDRVYELVIWVSFSSLELIPPAIPLIVISRTTLTDALRSVGVRQGQRAFDQHRSRLGQFLVRSKWMRSSYGISKALSFAGLTLGIALQSYPDGSDAFSLAPRVIQFFEILAWVSVGFCVLRGLPVIVGAARRALEPNQ